VCEYVGGEAKCGTVLELSSPQLAPLTPALQDHVALVKADLKRQNTKPYAPLALPGTCLVQPCKVLLEGMVAARRRRRTGSETFRKAQEASGMFHDVQLGMLRHAFVQLCSGDGEEVGLPAGKLKELAVFAELELTDAITLDVLAKLVRAPSKSDLSHAPQNCCLDSLGVW
jgi:hypothetical protein